MKYDVILTFLDLMPKQILSICRLARNIGISCLKQITNMQIYF